MAASTIRRQQQACQVADEDADQKPGWIVLANQSLLRGEPPPAHEHGEVGRQAGEQQRAKGERRSLPLCSSRGEASSATAPAKSTPTSTIDLEQAQKERGVPAVRRDGAAPSDPRLRNHVRENHQYGDGRGSRIPSACPLAPARGAGPAESSDRANRRPPRRSAPRRLERRPSPFRSPRGRCCRHSQGALLPTAPFQYQRAETTSTTQRVPIRRGRSTGDWPRPDRLKPRFCRAHASDCMVEPNRTSLQSCYHRHRRFEGSNPSPSAGPRSRLTQAALFGLPGVRRRCGGGAALRTPRRLEIFFSVMAVADRSLPRELLVGASGRPRGRGAALLPGLGLEPTTFCMGKSRWHGRSRARSGFRTLSLVGGVGCARSPLPWPSSRGIFVPSAQETLNCRRRGAEPAASRPQVAPPARTRERIRSHLEVVVRDTDEPISEERVIAEEVDIEKRGRRGRRAAQQRHPTTSGRVVRGERRAGADGGVASRSGRWSARTR